MLRHRAFFEELASLDETDLAWRSATAGLLVLRLIDTWIEDGIVADAWTLRNVDAAISEVDERSILRGLLEGLARAVRSEGAELNRIVSPFMAYLVQDARLSDEDRKQLKQLVRSLDQNRKPEAKP